jgi:hypothetical protein
MTNRIAELLGHDRGRFHVGTFPQGGIPPDPALTPGVVNGNRAGDSPSTGSGEANLSRAWSVA